MASRCTCRSTDCWLRTFSSYSSKNGRIWLYKIFYRSISNWLRLLCLICLCTESYSNYLYIFSRPYAGRYEKINSVLISCAYGFCHTWDFYYDTTGIGRKYFSNDQSWNNFCCTIFMCRCHLRKNAYKRD